MGIKLFSDQQQTEIKDAIQKAEFQTSGEIRVFLEETCNEEVLDRAVFHFKQLGMHETTLRNGVLIYLATDDRKFAIIGDSGINSQTGNDFWDQAKEQMLAKFKEGNLTEGLTTGITMVGDALKKYFPYKDGDKNELPDDIAFNS